MEGGTRIFLLKLAFSILFLLPAIASSAENENQRELKPVIQPEIVRSTFTESDIDVSDFEIIANWDFDIFFNPYFFMRFGNAFDFSKSIYKVRRKTCRCQGCFSGCFSNIY